MTYTVLVVASRYVIAELESGYKCNRRLKDPADISVGDVLTQAEWDAL